MSVTSSRWIWGTRILVVASLVFACVLLWISKGGSVAGCGPKSTCDEVLSSRWSSWQGIPVAALAVAAYVGLLLATFGINGDEQARRTKLSWAGVGFFSVTILGAAAWFTLVQTLVIKKFCPFCMGAHACGGLASLVLLWKSPYIQELLKRRSISLPGFVFGLLARPAVLLGVVATVVLIAGQRPPPPRLFRVEPLAGGAVFEADAAGARTLFLMDKQFKSLPGQDPLIGNPQAPLLLVLFFDFTCPQCRMMHEQLGTLRQQLGDRFAFYCLPSPLDQKCNPAVPKTQRDHINACELAKLALAVWKVAPEKYAAFDQWMFAGERAPLLAAAREYATGLIGADALAKALADPDIETRLARNVTIYRENIRKTGSDELPQMMVNGELLTGVPDDPGQLASYLEQQILNAEQKRGSNSK